MGNQIRPCTSRDKAVTGPACSLPICHPLIFHACAIVPPVTLKSFLLHLTALLQFYTCLWHSISYFTHYSAATSEKVKEKVDKLMCEKIRQRRQCQPGSQSAWAACAMAAVDSYTLLSCADSLAGIKCCVTYWWIAGILSKLLQKTRVIYRAVQRAVKSNWEPKSMYRWTGFHK